MLKIKNVSKTFNPGTVNEKKALNNINLEVHDGDFITIIGGNGAGKSTLMNMIAGVYPIDCGYIYLADKNISLLKEHQRAQMIGRVFQDPMLGTASDMAIQENLAMANRRGMKRGLRWGITKEEKEVFYKTLQTFGVRSRRQNDSKGWTFIWWAKTGIDFVNGNSKKTSVIIIG